MIASNSHIMDTLILLRNRNQSIANKLRYTVQLTEEDLLTFRRAIDAVIIYNKTIQKYNQQF